MGSSFSSATTTNSFPTAKVITPAGSLNEYSVPVTASSAIGSDHQSGYFLCSSDKLYFDTYIPTLGPKDLLQPGQIYFVLPNAKLDYPLSGSDMAALAGKAGAALARASKKRGKGRGIRVMPVEMVCEEDHGSWRIQKIKGSKANIRVQRLSTIVEADE